MGVTYSVRIQLKYSNVDSIMKLICHRSDLNERLSTSKSRTRKRHLTPPNQPILLSGVHTYQKV